jgi:hypothetical protein
VLLGDTVSARQALERVGDQEAEAERGNIDLLERFTRDGQAAFTAKDFRKVATPYSKHLPSYTEQWAAKVMRLAKVLHAASRRRIFNPKTREQEESRTVYRTTIFFLWPEIFKFTIKYFSAAARITFAAHCIPVYVKSNVIFKIYCGSFYKISYYRFRLLVLKYIQYLFVPRSYYSFKQTLFLLYSN